MLNLLQRIAGIRALINEQQPIPPDVDIYILPHSEIKEYSIVRGGLRLDGQFLPYPVVDLEGRTLGYLWADYRPYERLIIMENAPQSSSRAPDGLQK